MKKCFYCQSTIPADAATCPMCGLDLTEVETSENRTQKVSRKDKHQFSFKKIMAPFLSYVRYMAAHVRTPFKTSYPNEVYPLHGYITVLLSALFSAGIVTRVVAALDQTYQFFISISILPALVVNFNGFEWFLKLSIFFFFNIIVLTGLSYLFKSKDKAQTATFNHWLAYFTSINTLYHILLIVFFIVAMVVPIGLGVPALLFVCLYHLSYIISYIFTLENEKTSKKFYQALISLSVYYIVMALTGYLLIRI